MKPTDLMAVTWRKSSYSTGNAACVELARTPEVVAVRDSKDPGGGVLVFPAGSFGVFVRRL